MLRGGVGAGVRQRQPRMGPPATNTANPCSGNEIHASYAL
jgi:hypothetical protein